MEGIKCTATQEKSASELLSELTLISHLIPNFELTNWPLLHEFFVFFCYGSPIFLNDARTHGRYNKYQFWNHMMFKRKKKSVFQS